MQRSIVILSILIILASCTAQKKEAPVTRIAFGSCGHQDDPQPVLGIAAEQKPDAFIFLGDNMPPGMIMTMDGTIPVNGIRIKKNRRTYSWNSLKSRIAVNGESTPAFIRRSI